MKKKFKIVIIIFCSIVILISGYFLYRYFLNPTIELVGEPTVYLEVNDAYKEEGLKELASKKERNKKEIIYIENKIDNSKIGTYDVIYKYKGKEIIRKVKVVDKKPPQISLVGNNKVDVCNYESYVEEGYTSIDNYDGDITDKVKVYTKDNMKYYEVSDTSANKTTITREMVINDKEAPKLNLTMGSNITVIVGSTYNDKYEAIDNCDGNITNKVIVTGSVDTNKTGSYVLTYEVSDSFNNKTVEQRKITVKEKTMYTGSTIYLTFDDGPSKEVTPFILDILKKYDIKATFFVINHGSGTDYLIKRAYDEGHTIGLHSYTHNYNIYRSSEAYFDDLKKIEEKVISLTNESSKIIRFPGGSSNTVSKNYSRGIMSKLAIEVQDKGYSYFDWNVGSSDTASIDATKVCNNVKNRLGTGTNIVLMHDYSRNTKNIKALECIIEYGLDRGYSFDKITKSTKNIHHGIAN